MRTVQLLTLALTALFSSSAQAPPPVQAAQGPILTSNARLVQLSVLVHDKKGFPVRDLTREDFAILDNGQMRQVAVFSIVSEPADAGAVRASASPLAVSNRNLRRTSGPSAATIILLDSVNMRTVEELQYVQRELPKFLKNLHSGDPIALYSLGGAKVRVIHDFTDDAESLIRAAQHTTKNPVFTTAPATAIGGGYFQSLDDWLNSSRIQDQRAIARWRTEWTLSALESIAQHAAGLPGRKNMVWISSAFPLIIGLDPDTIAQESVKPGDTELESYRARLKRLAELYNNADIAVYPVDPRGLMIDDRYSVSERIPAGIQQARMKTVGEITEPEIATMLQLASDTGGRAFYNANDLEGSLRRALDDAQGAYLIGFYAPDSAWDGRYHKLDVKVNRTDVEVRSRRGYYAIERRVESEPVRNEALKLAAASPLEGASIGVTVNVTSNPLEFGTQHIEVEVDPHNVRFESQNGKWHTSFDAVFVQQSPDGSIIAGESLQFAFNFKTYELAQAQMLLIRRDAVIKQGGARLRVIVRDSSTGAVGSVSVPIEQNHRSKGH
jgi:VWFA-related protein